MSKKIINEFEKEWSAYLKKESSSFINKQAKLIAKSMIFHVWLKTNHLENHFKKDLKFGRVLKFKKT